MKNKSIIFKSLGVVFIAILCYALYDIAGHIFPEVNGRSIPGLSKDINGNDVPWTVYMYRTLPYLLLVVFFIYLRKEFPESKSAKYALRLAVVSAGLLVCSDILNDIYLDKLDSLEKLQQERRELSYYDYDYDHDYDDKIERKIETINTLYKIKDYLSYAFMFMIIAFLFATETLKRNKKLWYALLAVIIAMIFKYVYRASGGYYNDRYYCIYIENWYIVQMICNTVWLSSFAYLFFAYSRPDVDQEVEVKKLTRNDWMSIAGVLVTMILFFCNWMDYEKISDDRDWYFTFGCHVVPIASLGLAVMGCTIMSVLSRSDTGKKISGIGMIVWPLVVCISTLMFDLYDGHTVGELLEEGKGNDGLFKKINKIADVSEILAYTVCSVVTGIIILSGFEAKPNVPKQKSSPDSSSDKEEILRLKAEIELLKGQLGNKQSEDNTTI